MLNTTRRSETGKRNDMKIQKTRRKKRNISGTRKRSMTSRSGKKGGVEKG